MSPTISLPRDFAAALYLTMLVVLRSTSAASQTIVESATGSSSIILQQGGIAFINFGDQSVKLGQSYIISSSQHSWGFDAKVQAPNGFSDLTRPSSIQGEGRLFFRYMQDSTKRLSTSKGLLTIWWATLQLSGSQGSYSVATSTSAAAVQRSDQTSYGFALKLYHDAMWNVSGETFLSGISVGIARANNYSDLPKVSVCEQLASQTAGTFVSSIEKCKDARLGAFEDRTKPTGAADLLWYPKAVSRVIAPDIMLRYDGADQHPGTIGIGLFFAKPGSPSNILGGPTIQWRRDEKAKIGVQIGFPF